MAGDAPGMTAPGIYQPYLNDDAEMKYDASTRMVHQGSIEFSLWKGSALYHIDM